MYECVLQYVCVFPLGDPLEQESEWTLNDSAGVGTLFPMAWFQRDLLRNDIAETLVLKFP